MVKIDIEMPTYCYDCPCHNGENGRCNITGDSVYDKRPFDCPLKEGKNKIDDLISKQVAIMALVSSNDTGDITCGQMAKVLDVIKAVPSAQPEGWLEQNKDKILQAGIEGREIDFYIDGRLFTIREKAQ